ncbi:MAG: 50S ribosomal protein L9 [Candidatus Binatia bacterium]|nr:MAG: 50S ribosomal protein L9 [Candidatus Binatia bacterium]
MEVILRAEIPNLGRSGEIVKVRPGFARNYLIPRGLAVVADRRNRRLLEHEQRVAAARFEREKRASETLAQKLTQMRLVVRVRAGEEGKLFGSVTNLDIERLLAEQGIKVERRRIRLPEPIKTLGEHTVPVHLPAGVVAHLTVAVEPIA